MKPRFLDSQWKIARPLRASTIGFVTLSILFGAVTPLVEESISRWTFLLGGIGYSAVLVLASVGISILPIPIRRRVFLAVMICMASGFIGMIGILGIVSFGLSLTILDVLLPILSWISYLGLAMVVMFAIYGWWHHAFSKRSCN